MSKHKASRPSPARASDLHLRSRHHPRKATFVSAFLLVTFYVVLYSAGPAHLPWLFQRLVAATNALLAMSVIVFALGESSTAKQSIRLLGWRLEVGMAIGLVVFILVFAWWISPWAPIPVQPSANALPS
jgi:hypothetical protein